MKIEETNDPYLLVFLSRACAITSHHPLLSPPLPTPRERGSFLAPQVLRSSRVQSRDCHRSPAGSAVPAHRCHPWDHHGMIVEENGASYLVNPAAFGSTIFLSMGYTIWWRIRANILSNIMVLW